MASRGDLGERLKPLVFLDHLSGRVPPGSGFGFHPHSGIATLTYQLNADATYEDTAGQKGVVKATGPEWMRAAGGINAGATVPLTKTVDIVAEGMVGSRVLGAPQVGYSRLSRRISFSMGSGSWLACRWGRRLRSVSPSTPQPLYRR
jgi:hypothetical protein